jgi:hypothetical protein
VGRLDPAAETLEVFRLHEGRWLLLDTSGGDTSVRAEPFDAVELALGPPWDPVR